MNEKLPLTNDEVISARVEPGLLELAFEVITDAVARGGRRKPDPLDACFQAYVEYYDILPDDVDATQAFARDAQRVIAATFNRVVALSKLASNPQLAVWNAGADEADCIFQPALIDAACAATLLIKGDEPSFQLFEFLARVEAARKAGPA